MHDPMTVAFTIRYPWWTYRPWPKRTRHSSDSKWVWEQLSEQEKTGRSQSWREGYRDSFITIWHVDPERRGDDDSCGFTVPHLTRKQIERLKNFAWHEARNPYYMRVRDEEYKGPMAEAEAIYRGLLLHVADLVGVPMTFEQAAREAASVIHCPDCVPRSGFLCFKPGYHTNSERDDRDLRQEVFHGRICGMARWLLKDRRPWWRHPRWHFWHWRFQIHPLQEFKRWAFSRCERCGKRFAWGESPVSGAWHGTGPRWFRGEKNVRHCECSTASVEGVKQS